jgi:hypothetical protein
MLAQLSDDLVCHVANSYAASRVETLADTCMTLASLFVACRRLATLWKQRVQQQLYKHGDGGLLRLLERQRFEQAIREDWTRIQESVTDRNFYTMITPDLDTANAINKRMLGWLASADQICVNAIDLPMANGTPSIPVEGRVLLLRKGAFVLATRWISAKVPCGTAGLVKSLEEDTFQPRDGKEVYYKVTVGFMLDTDCFEEITFNTRPWKQSCNVVHHADYMRHQLPLRLGWAVPFKSIEGCHFYGVDGTHIMTWCIWDLYQILTTCTSLDRTCLTNDQIDLTLTLLEHKRRYHPTASAPT